MEEKKPIGNLGNEGKQKTDCFSHEKRRPETQSRKGFSAFYFGKNGFVFPALKSVLSHADGLHGVKWRFSDDHRKASSIPRASAPKHPRRLVPLWALLRLAPDQNAEWAFALAP